MGDSESDSEAGEDDNNYALRNMKTSSRRKILKRLRQSYLEEGIENDDMTLTTTKLDKSELEEEIKSETSIHGTSTKGEESKRNSRTKVTGFQLPKVASAMTSISNLEQSMPADAVLAKAGAAEVSKCFHYAEGWLMKPFFASFCKVLIQLLCLWELLPWKMYLKVVIRWNFVPYPMLIICLPVELIGEEIYDEFDQEGAYGDRVPYESLSDTRDCDDGNPEDPYHLSSITKQRAQSDTISWNGQAKSSATVLPTSLKGLEFFRTRSAPPVPREIGTDKYVGDDKVTGREWDKTDEEKDGTSRGRDPTAIQMPKPIKGTGRYPPSIILEQHSTISSYDSAYPTVISVEAKGLTVPPSTHQNHPSSVMTTPAPAPARLTPSTPLPRPQTGLPTQMMSTLPTLEAILLERKRRASNTNVSNSSSPVPSGPHINPTFIPPRPAPSVGLIHSVPGNPVAPLTGGSVTPLTSRVVHSSGKGTRFKSSPLGGGDKAGVIVAEQVKAAKKSEDVQSPDQE